MLDGIEFRFLGCYPGAKTLWLTLEKLSKIEIVLFQRTRRLNPSWLCLLERVGGGSLWRKKCTESPHILFVYPSDIWAHSGCYNKNFKLFFFVCVESFLNRNVFFIILGLRISRSRRQLVQYLLRSHCSSPLGLLVMSYPRIQESRFLVRSLKSLLKAAPLHIITLAVYFQYRNLRKCLKIWKHRSDTHAKVRQLKSRWQKQNLVKQTR